MSELKAYLCIQAREIEIKTFSCYNQTLAVKNAPEATMAQVYLKSEADEVISTIRSERDEYRYNLSCARNEIHNLSMSMREDVKRIADKDKVIAELEERIADGDNDFDMANSQNERLLKIVRRYKYKRAIDKAKWCKAELRNIRNTPLCDMNTHEIWQHDDEFWQRWRDRWLKIAEQFEEAK